MKTIKYTTDSSGNRRYKNLTGLDRRIMRKCHNQRRSLSDKEKMIVFGTTKPINFVNVNH